MIATYASYVWACYGVTAAVLFAIAFMARRSHTQAKQLARRRLQMNAGTDPASNQLSGDDAS
jgi:heme exporter protein CcmD